MIDSKHEHLKLLAQEYATADCPTCVRQGLARTPLRQKLDYNCPVSGFPTHCSQDCYDADAEHQQNKEALRTIHSDLLDLCSGRAFPEFDFPGPAENEVEITNWVKYFFDRKFRCE